MEIRKNEILFIYNSGSLKDRQALGYAKTLRSYRIKELDVQNQPITRTQLKELANRLNVAPEKMVNRKSALFRDKYADKNLDTSDVLKALNNEPDLIRTPIAVYETGAEFLKSPYDFVKTDMSASVTHWKAGDAQKTKGNGYIQK